MCARARARVRKKLISVTDEKLSGEKESQDELLSGMIKAQWLI